MTKHRERLAALRLAALLEEFTAQELEWAAEVLSGSAPLPPSLETLLRPSRTAARSRTAPNRPAYLRESKAVRALKERDPARYDLLAGFESQLRRGEALPGTRSLGQFVRGLAIDVRTSGSRQDIVSRIMAYLAELPLEGARQIITAVPEGELSDDGYHRLATYLHKGYDPGATHEPARLPNESEPTQG